MTVSTLFLPSDTSYGEIITSPTFQERGNSAEEWDEETKDILQSSLSIVEIDKEIARLEQRLLQLEQHLAELDVDLLDKELQLVEKREAAGKVLRSYFMGDRTDLLLSILGSTSLESVLKKIEFYELIMKHDQHILNSYKDQHEALEQQYGEYTAEQIKIEQATLALQEQREEVIRLEKQIDEKLANRDDSEKILLLMDELTRMWNEEGIEQVEHYLYLLNDAMQKFPTWLQKQSEYTKIKALTYTINLPEQALNDFLREQHEDFNHFAFSFTNDQLVVKGQDDNLEIELIGQYTIIDEPRHFIQFTIDSLYFNKFSLPKTTIDDLMLKYDLNFYPALIVSFLRATEVQLSDGYLKIELKLKL